VNQLRRPVLIKLLAQAVNVYLEEIGFTIEMAIPNMLDDFAASDELGGAQQQELEEREFFGSERNDLLTPSGAAPVPIQGEVRIAQPGIPGVKTPPD
jgi:hypothetical protein